MPRFIRRAAVVLGMLLLSAVTAASAAGQDKFLEKIMQALPDKAPVQPKQPRKVLVYSKTAGFRHSSIPVGVKAIAMLGDKTGAYTALASEDESMFDADKLKAFDAVFMLNTTGDCLKPKIADLKNKELVDAAIQREEVYKKNLEAFVAGGKGLIGVHSATDTYHDKRGPFVVEWPAYGKMMGGAFVSHPWNSNSKVAIKNIDPEHPLNAAFDGKDFEIVDEIYQFRDDTAMPNDRRYLLMLDPAKRDRGSRKDGFYPISWLATYGKGRNFYCSLGHNDHIYWNPMVLKHYLAGIQYALGDLPADASPRMNTK